MVIAGVSTTYRDMCPPKIEDGDFQLSGRGGYDTTGAIKTNKPDTAEGNGRRLLSNRRRSNDTHIENQKFI